MQHTDEYIFKSFRLSCYLLATTLSPSRIPIDRSTCYNWYAYQIGFCSSIFIVADLVLGLRGRVPTFPAALSTFTKDHALFSSGPLQMSPTSTHCDHRRIFGSYIHSRCCVRLSNDATCRHQHCLRGSWCISRRFGFCVRIILPGAALTAEVIRLSGKANSYSFCFFGIIFSTTVVLSQSLIWAFTVLTRRTASGVVSPVMSTVVRDGTWASVLFIGESTISLISNDITDVKVLVIFLIMTAYSFTAQVGRSEVLFA